jgi:hypothetical protein
MTWWLSEHVHHDVRDTLVITNNSAWTIMRHLPVWAQILRVISFDLLAVQIVNRHLVKGIPRGKRGEHLNDSLLDACVWGVLFVAEAYRPHDDRANHNPKPPTKEPNK